MTTEPEVINIAEDRNLGGRPPYVPTDDLRRCVQELRANGISLDIIASTLQICENTMRKHYATELSDGHDMVKARVGSALVRAALSGNVNAMKFWLVMRGGPEWRLPKGAAVPGDDDDSGETVHIYIPANGRDRPEIIAEPPIIEGTLDSDAA